MKQTVRNTCWWACSTSRAACALGFVVLLVCSRAQAHTLLDLIREAVEVHPAVRSAVSSRIAAGSDLETARWQYFPTPSVSVQQSGSNSDPAHGDRNVTTWKLEQPVWQGGRLDLGVKRGGAQIKEREAVLAVVRHQIALSVLQAFGDWYTARRKLEATDESREVHQNLLLQIERRVGEGLSARSDAALAAARLEQVRFELEGYRTQLSVALGRLEQLLGRSIGSEELAHVLVPDSSVDGGLEEIRAHALGRDPTIRRAAMQYELLAIDADLAAAGRWPSVTMSVEQQYGASYLGGAKEIYRAGIGVQASLGAGLSVSSAIDAARARARAAQGDLEAAKRNVADQVQADFRQYGAFKLRRDSLDAALRLSRDVRQSYDRQYMAGGKSWVDVMNAVRELAQLSVQAGDVEGGILVSGWRLAIYVQGVSALLGLPEDFADREGVSP